MKLEEIRKKIDRIDDALFDFLHERLQLAKQIKAVKDREGKPIADPDREETLLKRLEQKAVTYDMDPEFVRGIFSRIIQQSKTVQEES